ncbi:phage tail tape measure protein [Arthrobacter sp. AQ5-05]|uniref:phage tail tape measure protein n=1 Tax=Arthrobacter sp. AQ5-05 TaxID=2184581 RepID=UPI000DCE6A8C|nr:phage tail tape measure protein [Arthrobacter sp. AQ5-05]RAX50856.1 phage tail tape measure protein [Arthrobacter sp. AQ5-05]
MATRDVTVRIKAEIGSFKRDMMVAAGAARKAAAETEAASTKASSSIGKLGRVAGMHEKAWGQVSTGLVAGGVAAAGGVALVTKAAIDWESAWTGVKKTVDGTPKQLAEVEGGLRNLARTLPSTHTEIAAVAEAAGQLGVKTGDVVGFTKTMIDLGETTNLTAEEAATNIAQISNVMGTMKREGTEGVERFGSALVALGNNGASTEAEILSMAQRIAGAGATIKASETDVLALSSTLASMGIRAEMGGGVASRVLLKMRSAVDEGGDSLETFAETAGVTADEFSAKFREDPVAALALVSKGIDGVNQSGGNVTKTLKDMGIKGTEETQVMLALASSGDLLTDSLNLGAEAWGENSALMKEADQRYSTTESKIKAAFSSIQDSAITFGGVMLPVVAGVAEAGAGIATAFAKIPAPIAGALTVLTGFVGVGALVAGVGMKMVGSFTSTIGGLKALGLEFPGLTGKMEKFGNAAPGVAKKFAKFAGAAVAIGAVTVAIAKLAEASYMSKIDEGMGRVDLAMAKIINNAPDATDALDDLFKNKDGAGLTDDIDSLGTAIDRTFNKTSGQKFNDWGEGAVTFFTGIKGSLAMTQDAFGRIDQSLADLVGSGNVEGAKTAFDGIAAKFVEQGRTVEEAKAMFPGYADALSGVAAEAANAGGGLEALGAGASGAFAPSKEMAEALADIGVAADGSVASLGAFTDYLFNSGLAMMSSKDAAFQWAKGLRDMDGEIKKITDSQGKMGAVLNKGKTDFNKNTDAGYEGLQLFQGKLQEGIAVAQTYAADTSKSQKDVVAQYQATYDAGIKSAEGFGIMGEKADALVRKALDIPKDVTIAAWVDDQATAAAERITGQLLQMPKDLKIKALVTDDGTAKLTKEQIAAIKGQTVGIEVTDEGTVLTTQGKIDGVTDGDAKILVRDDGTISIIQGGINNVKDGAANVNVTESGLSWVQQAINSVKDGYAQIHIKSVYSGDRPPALPGGRGGPTRGGYTGGLVGQLINGLAGGGLVPGQVPLNSQGDNVLATVGGKPFGLRSGEMVVNEKATSENYPLLKAINDGATVRLDGLADGGRVGAAEKKVTSTKRAYDRISGDKANRLRKLAAKDQYDAAKAELAAVKKSSKASTDAAKKDAEARQRLAESRRDLRTDLRRGNITDAFTSGSGLGQVDRLWDASRNKDYSMGKRRGLARDANALEKSLTRLTKYSDELTTALDNAKSKADELRSVRDSVAGGLRGEFSLSGMLSNTKQDLGSNPFTAKSISVSANKMAKRIENFAWRLKLLRKMGYGEAIIQEVAGLGVDEGLQVASVLLSASGKEKQNINGAYKRLDSASGKAGQYVTESMYKGGLDAADGLVRGLESKTKGVESAFYKLGKNAEKAFKRSLGIKSPSRVMFGAGVNVGEGAELGILSKVGDVQGAMGMLAEAPAFSVPPSAEVARYAAQPAHGGGVDTQAIANAVAGAIASYQPIVSIDGRKFYGVMQAANQQARRR